jgi:hypothetical protein
VPIHLPLALLDPDQHLLTVDVCQLEVEHLVQAQPGRVRDLHRHTFAQARHRRQ